MVYIYYYYYYYIRLTAFFQDNLGKLAPEKQNHSGKTNLDLLEQEIVSDSGISWAICKSAPRFRQIAIPATHHSVFHRPDALPATQPTASKHWRLVVYIYCMNYLVMLLSTSARLLCMCVCLFLMIQAEHTVELLSTELQSKQLQCDRAECTSNSFITASVRFWSSCTVWWCNG